jgi:hypothetical protein
MLSRKQISIANYIFPALILAQGNLLAQLQKLFYVNMTVVASRNNIGISYAPAGGQLGAGYEVRRCLVVGAVAVSTTRAAAGSVDVFNNDFVFCGNAFGFPATTIGVCSHNFFAWSAIGASLNNNVSTNLVAHDCGACFATVAATTFSACQDATLPVAAGNLLNQNPRTQLRTFYDVASPGQKKFPMDGRLYLDSVLVGAGTPVVAVPRDADGVLRPRPPAQGPWEPRLTCYAPAGELLRGTTKRGVNS